MENTNENKKQHTKRKDKEKELKQKLIREFGYGEIKKTWEELHNLLGLGSMTSTIYQIHKLIKEGFLECIQKAERQSGSGEYWSSNVFKIVKPIEENKHAPEISDNIFKDITNGLEDLMSMARKTAKLEEENRQLRLEKQEWENIAKNYQQQALALKHQIFKNTNSK
jgi:hypothetical protein